MAAGRPHLLAPTCPVQAGQHPAASNLAPRERCVDLRVLCRRANGAAAEHALREAAQRATITFLSPRALFGPSPRTNMLRIALPQLCGALGAAAAPCRFFHRLSGPVYLYGRIAVDAVTYLHRKRALCNLQVVRPSLYCRVRFRAATWRTGKTVSAWLGRVDAPGA
jgi:hypothetical protein